MWCNYFNSITSAGSPSRLFSCIIFLRSLVLKRSFVTISEVKVSSDFSYAKVYVSFILEKDIKPGLEVLEHSKGFIRSSLAKKMDTRRIPELSFVLDDGYKKEERITELLNGKK